MGAIGALTGIVSLIVTSIEGHGYTSSPMFVIGVILMVVGGVIHNPSK
jgi:hypothetical protein